MSDGGLNVLDGTQLLSLNLTLPEHVNVPLTGAQFIDLAESTVSDSLFGLSLPQHLKTAALRCVTAADAVDFHDAELSSEEEALEKLKVYVAAIADALTDDPLVVSILDGSALRLFLEDEDDFAMLAENLFTDLDIEDKGKICKGEIRNALVHMGVELGIPPFSDFPQVNDILKKHGAEGKEELGQSQFAELLQPVLQEIADALAEEHIVVTQNIKVFNGSKLKKLLANEKKLNSVIEKILQEKVDDEKPTEQIRTLLEKNGSELGLPPLSEANEAVILLYNTVFSETEKENSIADMKDNYYTEFIKESLKKFAEQLETNPVYSDLVA